MRKMVHIATSDRGPTKTVTIRGVNREVYDRFGQLSLAFGANTGQIFTGLIDSYGKQYHPMLGHARMRMIMHDNSTSIEVIKDLDELTISRKDLVEAGENVRYIFRSIGKLTFDETVDNKTLLKHVLRIAKSEVETKGEISRLFLLSINQGKQLESYFANVDPEITNVTIRNVSEEVYTQFTASCHANKVKIGDAVTDLLKRALPHLEISQIMIRDHKINQEMIVLTMHPHIEVTNQDLLDLEGRQVLFHRITNIHFDDDVDGELFRDTVMGIYKCNNVRLGENIPRLLGKSRVHAYP
ncbi:MAG: hypothetical protein ACXAE3_06445 [Candidatus Kariarchaeaceae archaeon]|jgi:hypothetical protein